MGKRFQVDWRALRFTGPDRKKFLNGQLTADVLNMGKAALACLLTPKGRLRGVLELHDEGDSILALCDPLSAAHAKEDLGRKIMLADAKMEEVSPPRWNEDGKWGWEGERGGPGFEDWLIEQGIPLYGRDIDESTLPQEAGLDAAISYTKGCYMGQETMSRIHHMGHVNRRLVRFKGAPPPELKVTSQAGEWSLGWVKAGSGLGEPVVVKLPR